VCVWKSPSQNGSRPQSLPGQACVLLTMPGVTMGARQTELGLCPPFMDNVYALTQFNLIGSLVHTFSIITIRTAMIQGGIIKWTE
jgi:hypothetical protein